MELTDLVGSHILTGVDLGTEKSTEEWAGEFQDCTVIRFCLDGVIYCVFEDPDDGYRSAMKEIKISQAPVMNTFMPVSVVGRMKDNESSQTNNTLQLIDVGTGRIVLEVGTDNTDDYYPWFVAEFNPQNMTPAVMSEGS